MVISKQKAQTSKVSKAEITKIDKQYDLFFCFRDLCRDKDSMKFIERNPDVHKKLSESYTKLTKFHLSCGEKHNSLDVKGETAPCGYKKLSGAEGISGYMHKFKLDRANSVLVNEKVDKAGGKLHLYLGEVGNFHKG